MPSDNIVRSYIQGNIINGQLFDDRYVDKMETGIEDSFKYSNYLEAKMLPQMGVLDKNIDLNNFKAPGVYELNGASNANLPFTPVHGSLFVLAGPHQVQMVVGSEALNSISKAYFRRFLIETSTFSEWTTFDVNGSADEALKEAKNYIDTEIGNLGTVTDNQIEAINNKIAATRTELITYTDTAEQDAKNYADNAANTVKNDLLNGAGGAYDTLKELGDLIVENETAIDALEIIASGKAPAYHASSTTTYGIGTNDLYGHLKLSDSIESTSDVSGGMAATPKAVKQAYDQLASNSIARIIDQSSQNNLLQVVYGNGTAGAFYTRDTLYTMTSNFEEETVTVQINGSYENSSSSGVTIPAASTNSIGFMTAADKIKLDSITPGATTNVGTITGVTAGAGLTGGGTSGAVTLNVNTSFNTSGSNYKVNVDNSSGGLYVNVPWTDTKVTSSNNHYAPSGNQAAFAGQTAPGSISWDSTQVVTGLSWKHDGKGHITEITLDKAKMPANPNTDTTYTLSGAASGNTWVTTLTPSSGSASYSTVPAASTTTAGLMTPEMVQKLNEAASNTGTLTGITAGVGLTGGATSGNVTVKANLRNEIALTIDSVAATAVSGRVYPVVVDKSGYLAVTVPWTDENTGITSIPVATSGTIGGIKSGGDITIADTGIVSVNKVSQSMAGLMSAADKKKLDGIAENANNYTYTLPTANSSILGGVKSGSTISSPSGLTACPIIEGIPYYKEGVASLSSLGITATATELNYTVGVTSNIQTQLDNKANASHTHDYLSLSGGALRGRVYSSVDVAIDNASFRNIAIIAPGTSVTPGVTAIPTGTIWMRYEN